MEPQNNLELPNNGGQMENFNHYNHDGAFNFSNEVESSSIEKEALPAASPYEVVNNLFSPIQQSNPVSPQNQDGDTPAIQTPTRAIDSDLIEDEWVKELIKMIKSTKGDPHARESRFKQMQVDYMKKRYNRIINRGK